MVDNARVAGFLGLGLQQWKPKRLPVCVLKVDRDDLTLDLCVH